jgi:hypothetical protein
MRFHVYLLLEGRKVNRKLTYRLYAEEACRYTPPPLASPELRLALTSRGGGVKSPSSYVRVSKDHCITDLGSLSRMSPFENRVNGGLAMGEATQMSPRFWMIRNRRVADGGDPAVSS